MTLFDEYPKTEIDLQINHKLYLTRPFHLDRASLFCRCARLGEQAALGGRCARNSNKIENFLAFDAPCAYFTM